MPEFLFSQAGSEYLPDIDGVLKTKVEYDLDNLLLRFEVRNARFGVRGKINSYFSYRAELDLSDEGRIKMLDAYIRFEPVNRLSFFMGQRKIPFSTDYIRNPAENIFANRSFLAKYINDGLRDIGFYVNYRTSGSFPVDMTLGVVNGTGNNNPQWIEKPYIAARVTAGKDDGFRLAGNAYAGEAMDKIHLRMYGAEVRYSAGNLFLETEYIYRGWSDTLSVRQHDDGWYLHGYYNFKVKDEMLRVITPTARYDKMGSSVFGRNTEADRLTLGVNFVFEPKQFTAEIRFNYENYFRKKLPIHTDKITLEFIARF
ncbi:MAG: hypothetical protein GYA43_10470 [Bacteroidales bacterium]|nr:hypothetical protein [Bacteroidales bacterium]